MSDDVARERIVALAVVIGAKEPEPGVYHHGTVIFDADAKPLDVLEQLSESTRDCQDCQTAMWFVRSKRGKLVPYNADGSTHFETCPFADKYRKRSRRSP